MESDEQSRNHLFLSYAEEDLQFVLWLARKLTAQGYAVWCAKLNQLGGESYPKDIDNAIKNRTFRFLAVLSQAYLQKENPQKEQTLAVNLSKERKIDFIIPVNIGGVKPSELNWMISDLTFIPFHKGWANGFDQLMEKLASIDAPKPLLSNGKSIVATPFMHNESTIGRPEKVISNRFQFLKIPENVLQFYLPNGHQIAGIDENWAFYPVNDENVLAFTDPPASIDSDAEKVTDFDWKTVEEICGIPTRNVVTNLLQKSLHVACFSRGMKLCAETGAIYMPRSLTPKRIRIEYMGHPISIGYGGERVRHTIKGDTKFLFHLAPKFKIIQTGHDSFISSISIHLHITNLGGEPIRGRGVNSRRKSVCKEWWNEEWLKRYLAMMMFLSNGKSEIIVGGDVQKQVIASSSLIEDSVPLSVRDPAPGVSPSVALELEQYEEEIEDEDS
ncbi:MAG: toll/interleukin-1 receptor domain-containing protein [Candidatus Anstonellaceae archaeon]